MTSDQDYANHLRNLLGITPDTARFSGGRDQHRLTVSTIRAARELDGTGNATDLEQITGSGMIAALAWNVHILNERGPAAVVDHVNNLSPWDFCQFLADVAEANPRTGKQQADYFDAMAALLEAADPTVWLIVSGEDHYPEYIEHAILDADLARQRFDKRALTFEVKETQTLPDGGIKYRNGSEYIALQPMTTTTDLSG